MVVGLRKSFKERSAPAQDLKAQLEDVERRLQRQYEAIESGNMPAELVAERLQQLKDQKKNIEKELGRYRDMPDLPDHLLEPESLQEIQESLRSMFDGQNPKLVKRYLTFLIDKIEVSPDKVTISGDSGAVLATIDAKDKCIASDFAGVMHSNDKWQPVGESNPCDGTENPAS